MSNPYQSSFIHFYCCDNFWLMLCFFFATSDKSINVGGYSEELVKIIVSFRIYNLVDIKIIWLCFSFTFTKICSCAFASLIFFITFSSDSSFLSSKSFIGHSYISSSIQPGPLNHFCVDSKVFKLHPGRQISNVFFSFYMFPIFSLWISSTARHKC